jgi:hypothetical protein
MLIISYRKMHRNNFPVLYILGPWGFRLVNVRKGMTNRKPLSVLPFQLSNSLAMVGFRVKFRENRGSVATYYNCMLSLRKMISP